MTQIDQKQIFPILFVAFIIFYGAFTLWKNIAPRWDSSSTSVNETTTNEEQSCAYHNVAGLQLIGYLNTYTMDPQTDEDGNVIPITSSDELQYQFDLAANDPDVEAILLEIDSSGGLTVAAEEVSSAIEHADKPIIAVIRSSGLSSAYWIASATDYIFAAQTSDIGSIGINNSYLASVKNDEKEGYEYQSLTSGEYKDTGSPHKPLSKEERALLQKSIDAAHRIFEQTVAKNRDLGLEQVQALADGSSFISSEALSVGLIDEIGTTYDALEYIEGIIDEKAEVCWY